MDKGAALTGIVFVLPTGIGWEHLPQELGCGSGTTCWRRLRDWQIAGVWERLHRVLLDELGNPGGSSGRGRAWMQPMLDRIPPIRGRRGRPRFRPANFHADQACTKLHADQACAKLHDDEACDQVFCRAGCAIRGSLDVVPPRRSSEGYPDGALADSPVVANVGGLLGPRRAAGAVVQTDDGSFGLPCPSPSPRQHGERFAQHRLNRRGR